jgi:hypothetical protein
MGLLDRLFGRDAPAEVQGEPVEPGSVRITCTTTFMDGATRYEAGDIRTVPTVRAAYFAKHGWATMHGDASLNVQDGAIGTGDSNG